MNRVGHGLTVLAVAGLLATAARAAVPPTITVSGTVTIRGTAIAGGPSLGAYQLSSTDPLVPNPAAPGPEAAVPSPGDRFDIGGYVFALTQPNAIFFKTSLLNPLAQWTTIVASAVPGDAGSIPLGFQWNLPSGGTPTVSFTLNGLDVTAPEPALYDSSNLFFGLVPQVTAGMTSYTPGGESMTLTRLSPYLTKYAGWLTLVDPAIAGQIDYVTINGEVTLTRQNGGWLISDRNAFILRGGSTLVSGKALETGVYAGPIPEPQTYALMTLGMVATGTALRRRAARARPAGI